MRDDSLITALVQRAAAGEQDAWNAIVERYIPLVWSICVRHQLSRHDIDDVCQGVWLLLVENIGRIQDPAALPGWLATTTRRECLRVLRAADRSNKLEQRLGDDVRADRAAPEVDEDILAAELNAAVRAAFDELPRQCRDLLAMLAKDPPCSYAEISARMGVAVGSIGSRRGRCLDRMRRSSHLAAILDSEDCGVGVRQARGNRDD